MSNEGVKCPRDGNVLNIVYESEKLGTGIVKAYLYYKCPVCNYRQDIERLEIQKADDKVLIKRHVILAKT
ncbi:MAG: hypothetical protein QXP02_03215 [Desulfurococcaceae archaeon]